MVVVGRAEKNVLPYANSRNQEENSSSARYYIEGEEKGGSALVGSDLFHLDLDFDLYFDLHSGFGLRLGLRLWLSSLLYCLLVLYVYRFGLRIPAVRLLPAASGSPVLSDTLTPLQSAQSQLIN